MIAGEVTVAVLAVGGDGDAGRGVEDVERVAAGRGEMAGAPISASRVWRIWLSSMVWLVGFWLTEVVAAVDERAVIDVVLAESVEIGAGDEVLQEAVGLRDGLLESAIGAPR